MVGKEYRGKLPVGLDVCWLTCNEVDRQAHWNAHAIAAVRLQYVDHLDHKYASRNT